ncbi:hypothetical protein EDM58_11020 [Brevibacillus panacihumi]|uniref:Uncharacterized protein n=1 Tax=Brevibacillus panacihumi TaxID=497735 RepID=A0A3M8CS56_9BACL|nr:hypothetical protein EDM58_11020 [Brevibacillus panacihumi]
MFVSCPMFSKRKWIVTCGYLLRKARTTEGKKSRTETLKSPMLIVPTNPASACLACSMDKANRSTISLASCKKTLPALVNSTECLLRRNSLTPSLFSREAIC